MTRSVPSTLAVDEAQTHDPDHHVSVGGRKEGKVHSGVASGEGDGFSGVSGRSGEKLMEPLK